MRVRPGMITPGAAKVAGFVLAYLAVLVVVAALLFTNRAFELLAMWIIGSVLGLEPAATRAHRRWIVRPRLRLLNRHREIL